MNAYTIQLLFQAWIFDILLWSTVLLSVVLIVDFVLANLRHTLLRSSLWNACWIAFLLLPVLGLITPKADRISKVLFPITSAEYWTAEEDSAVDSGNIPIELASEMAGDTQRQQDAEGPIAAVTYGPAAQRSSTSAWWWFGGAVTSVYFAGLLLMLCKLSIGIVYSRRLASSSIQLKSARWQNAFNAAIEQLGLPTSIQCGSSDKVLTPMVVGVFRPIVLIPTSMMKMLDQEEVESVLIHELVHIQRRDPSWNVLYQLTTALFWFHPLVWLGGERYTQARELACDDFCVGACESSSAYGETLLKIAAHQISERASGNLGTGIAFARGSKIGARIKFISSTEGSMYCRSNRIQRWVTTLGVGLVTVAMTVLSTNNSAYSVLGQQEMVFKDVELKQVIFDDNFYGMNCMDLSPQGEFIYASAWRTSSIHVYRVTGFEGKLVKVQTFRHQNLKNNSSVRVSPDGKWAVSGTGFGQAVVLMSRDQDTGKLTYADHYEADPETTGDRFFNDAVFSPNSKFIAAASTRSQQGESGSLSLFEVDAEEGKLEWHQVVIGDDNYADPRSIAFSKDGKTIVSSAVRTNSLAVFNFDESVPAITMRQVLANGHDEVRCLQKAFGSRFSPDERFVYTTGGRTLPDPRSDDAPMGVGVFQFDDQQKLRVVQQLTDETKGCESLGGGNELEVSNDGKYVITTLTDSRSVAVFTRDQSTGQLDLAKVVTVPDDPNFSPAGLAIGNDSRTIIVSSEDSRKLYRFKISEQAAE